MLMYVQNAVHVFNAFFKLLELHVVVQMFLPCHACMYSLLVTPVIQKGCQVAPLEAQQQL
jgi:hypothetical protein